MEDTNKITIASCSMCNNALALESIFCENCGYPENGSENDIAKFHAKKAMDNNKHVGADKKIKSARNTLYAISGLTFAVGLFLYFQNKDLYLLVTNFSLCIAYLGLAFWSSKKPLMALLIGLLLYLTTITISAIEEPTTLAKGILWKIIIISYLSKGIYSASSVEKVDQSHLK